MRLFSIFICGLLLTLYNCGGEVQIGDPNPAPQIVEPIALVVTNDGGFKVASFAWIDLGTRQPFVTEEVLSTSSGDILARVHNQTVYFLHRCDNVITIIDFDNIAEPTQWSYPKTGSCAPDLVDLVFTSGGKAYASYFASSPQESLAIIDLETGDRTGFIDLSSVVDPKDTDGRPEADQMSVVGNKLFLTLQELDISDLPKPVRPGKIVVIDTLSDTIETVIELQGMNPFNELIYDSTTDRIYVSEVGVWGVLDGGIEIINPDTLESEGFWVTEEDLGGDLTDFAVVSSSKGYALIQDMNLNTKVVPFSDSAAQAPILEVRSGEGNYLSVIELNSLGELYVGDRSVRHAGVWVINTVDDTFLTDEPIDVGLLPVDIVFVEP
ncbi:MAG: hypothetical protein HY538_08165 [Deltaproteobacteria bacterium]|nr:hypothetical protein [Deltaproteobacteria bacterium]